MAKFIKINIDQLGNSEVKTEGYSGNSCIEMLPFLEEALQARVQKSQLISSAEQNFLNSTSIENSISEQTLQIEDH